MTKHGQHFLICSCSQALKETNISDIAAHSHYITNNHLTSRNIRRDNKFPADISVESIGPAGKISRRRDI